MKRKSKSNQRISNVFLEVRGTVLIWQRQLADYLNTKCLNLSAKAMLALLIIFGVLAAAALLRLIINAIH